MEGSVRCLTATCRDAMTVIVIACPLIIDRKRKCHLYRTNQNKCNNFSLRIIANYVWTQFALRVTSISPFLRAAKHDTVCCSPTHLRRKAAALQFGLVSVTICRIIIRVTLLRGAQATSGGK